MRVVLALSALLFSCNVSAQYVCSPEQLRDRYAPGVPLGANGSCPPGYTIATFDNGLTNRCASPAVREDDYLDGVYGAFRSRNPDGTTKEIQNGHGERWLLYTRDTQGRPASFINPDQSVTILTWNGTNLSTRDTDGHFTRYHSWINGKPNAIETTGVGYLVMAWDKDRWSVNRVESIGTGGVLIGIDYTKVPLRSQSQSSVARSEVGVQAASAAPLFYIIDFAATPGLPLIAVGVAAVGGITLGTYIYPIIEPALTRVIDACANAVSQNADRQKCLDAAWARLERAIDDCVRTHKRQTVGAVLTDAEYKRLGLELQACQKSAADTYADAIRACMGWPKP